MVKSLLSRLALKKMVGLHVGDHDVTLCSLAVTALGPIELDRRSQPYTAETLGAVLGELLAPYAPRRRGAVQVPVALGLPAMRVFFTTRPIQVTDRDASPTVLLHEILRSTNVNVEEMEVDLIRGQPGKRPIASLVSCRRKYLANLLSAIGQAGIRPSRAEPAPFALLRLGKRLFNGPRKARSVARIFLGPSAGIAVLVTSGIPLAWRMFEMTAGDEPAALVAAVMSLQVVGRACGETEAVDAVIIHGRSELYEAFGAASFATALGAKVFHHPEPSYDDRSIALGLAHGCRPGEESFDLARTLKSRPPLREVIPWGQLVAQIAVLAGVTYMLDSQRTAVVGAHQMVRAECGRHAWLAKATDPNLDKEKKELEQKIVAIREYLDTRILWSTLARDAAARLPDSLFLRSFSGLSELDMGPKKMGAAKKSMVLKLSAPISKGQAMPREIDEYLNALRGDAMLQKNFQVVELADLKWFQPTAGNSSAIPQAEFTVNCLPKVEKPAAPKGPPGEAKSEH